MVMESLRNRNEADMVIALKALGNAGHPGSIKTIMRFLPGIAATPVDLPPRVLSAAVQSLRLIAARDPHSVRALQCGANTDVERTVDIYMVVGSVFNKWEMGK